MDIEIITLAGVFSYFADDLEVIRKAELKIKCNHVMIQNLEEFDIKAKVRASMKDKTYSVTVTVDGMGGISGATCECPRGKWVCSHMAAVAIYANKHGLSKTDLPNSWIHHPKKATKENLKPFHDIFPPTKQQYSALPRKVNAEDRLFLQEQLLHTNVRCPMMWITGPDPCSPPISSCNIIESICDIFQTFKDDKYTFLKLCEVDDNQIKIVSERTRLQRMSKLWGKMRKHRVTGSNFGAVIAAYNRHNTSGAYPESLYKTLCGEYNLSGKDAIMWGQMHEETAIADYKKFTGNAVEKVGLTLFPCGFLGCSPDGIIITEDERRGVLEIKCPWKYRNNNFQEILDLEFKGRSSAPGFYLENSTTINKKHNYWHQIQGEMASANLEWAHFVIWTNKDIKILTVERDCDWSNINLPKLKDFYLNKFLPKLTTVSCR